MGFWKIDFAKIEEQNGRNKKRATFSCNSFFVGLTGFEPVTLCL
jgi:hypothetical protein